MAGVNRVILIGRLGNDPEMRYMPTGEAVANLSVATSESWTDKPLDKAAWQISFEPNEEAPYCNRLIVNAPDDAWLQSITDGE